MLPSFWDTKIKLFRLKRNLIIVSFDANIRFLAQLKLIVLLNLFKIQKMLKITSWINIF